MTELPTQQEPRPRRAERSEKRRRVAVAVLLALVLVVVFAVAGVFVVKTMRVRSESARKIDQATVLIENADAVVVRVDGVVRAEVTPDLAEKASAASQQVTGAVDQLEQAVELLRDADAGSTDDDRERATLLIATAEARLDMLAAAPRILALNKAAATALPLGITAWQDTLAADRFSDQAVASYNKLTRAGVLKSRKLNIRAGASLVSARQGFVAAEKAFSDAAFERYIAYVDARLRLNALSRQSDVLWLKGDTEGANRVITAYNAEDRRAVVQARQLPRAPQTAVADAYKAASTAVTDEYYDARDAATKADKALRDF